MVRKMHTFAVQGNRIEHLPSHSVRNTECLDFKISLALVKKAAKPKMLMDCGYYIWSL